MQAHITNWQTVLKTRENNAKMIIIMLSDIAYISCNFDSYTRLFAHHFDFVKHTPRVIVERYRLGNNVTLDTFDFFSYLSCCRRV